LGFFANAYVVEVIEDDTGLSLSRTIYEVDLNKPSRALFSWDCGERPTGMHSYADGTLFCSKELRMLPGYPFRWHAKRDDEYLIEEGFLPEQKEDPVLFHLLLPHRFVPCPDRPLEQPSKPNVARWGDRLIVSYGVFGRADIRFWIRRIADGEGFKDYDLTRVLEATPSRSIKMEIEVGIPGVFKMKFS
jgi:hypothetical protein